MKCHACATHRAHMVFWCMASLHTSKCCWSVTGYEVVVSMLPLLYNYVHVFVWGCKSYVSPLLVIILCMKVYTWHVCAHMYVCMQVLHMCASVSVCMYMEVRVVALVSHLRPARPYASFPPSRLPSDSLCQPSHPLVSVGEHCSDKSSACSVCVCVCVYGCSFNLN